MNATVASLHLHPPQAGDPLVSVQSIDVIEQKGITGEPRYFGRVRSNGEVSRRQISLIEREQLAEHAAALKIQSIPSGAARANIETTGVNLVSLVGQKVRIGNAVLLFYEPRTPCEKMDAVCQGLRALMANARQGVMAEVVQSGSIRIGDAISPISE